jgi:hypothetical protein
VQIKDTGQPAKVIERAAASAEAFV